MPTLPPPRRPPQENDPRGGENLAAITVMLALIVLCLWLFHALADANAKLDCVSSGRTNAMSSSIVSGYAQP